MLHETVCWAPITDQALNSELGSQGDHTNMAPSPVELTRVWKKMIYYIITKYDKNSERNEQSNIREIKGGIL